MAEAQLAVLRVDVETKLGPLRRNMDKAQAVVQRSSARMTSSMERFRRKTVAAARSLLSFRNVAVGAAAATGLGLLVKRMIDTTEEIGKAADRIGITTRALQRLRFAADLAGVSMGQFDSALGGFAKRIGELRTRVDSELITALEDFNPALLEALRNTNSVEEALLLAADAMSVMESATERAAIASALFGRGAGLQMINLLRQGRGFIKDSGDELERLGGVIREDLVRAAEKAKDEITLLSRVISSNLSGAIISLTPDLEAGIELFGKWARTVRFLSDQFRELNDLGIDTLTIKLGDSIKKLQELRAELARTPTAFDRFRVFFAGRDVEKLIEQEERLQQRLKKLLAEAGAPGFETPKPPGSGTVSGGPPIPRRTMPEIEEMQRSARAEINRGFQDLALVRAPEEIARFDAERVRSIERFQELTAMAAGDMELQARAAELFEEEMRDIAAAQREAADSAERYSDFTLEAASAISGSLTSGIRELVAGTASAGEAMRGLLGTIAELIVKTTIQSTIEKLVLRTLDAETFAAKERLEIEEAITAEKQRQAVISAGQTGAGVPGGGAAGGGVVAGVIGTLGKILGFAGGGSFRPGQAFIAGERGPELIVAGRQGGTVVPNRALGFNVVIINRAPVQVSARERQVAGRQTLEVLVDQIDGAVARSIATGRGGQAIETEFDIQRRAVRR